MVTEERNENSKNIDNLDIESILQIINQEDMKVPLAIKEIIPKITPVVEAIVYAFKTGGRLVYIGAGTSGRLGVLDASECPPTYGTDPNMVVGLIAGGDTALRSAVEDAEDNDQLAKEDLIRINFSSKDILIGIAASGNTPYVLGGMKYAKDMGAKTVSISCNPKSLMKEIGDYDISIVVGPEVVTGSTRMKSGTAQKLVLNMLTTTSMIKYGKVYGNLMVDVQATNEKLRKRQIRIVCEATECDEEIAIDALKKSNNNSKLAIFYLLSGLAIEEAKNILENNEGYIRKALEQVKKIG